MEVCGPLSLIKKGVKNFISDDIPEFWGYYSSYDWVLFCWLFGTMMDLPIGYPMYCRDLKQWADQLGRRDQLPKQEVEHNALDDAKWNKMLYDFLVEKERIIALSS